MVIDAAEMMPLSGTTSPTRCHLNQDHQFNRRQRDHQRYRPTCSCLMAAVMVTLLGTTALAASIFTDYWERIDYNASAIELVARRYNGSHRLTWLFNNTIVKRSTQAYPRGSGTRSIRGGNSCKVSRSQGRLLSNAIAIGASTFRVSWTDQWTNHKTQRYPEGRADYDQHDWRNYRPAGRSTDNNGRSDIAGQGDAFRILREMGLDRNEPCTDYLALNGAEIAAGDSAYHRLSPNYLHHHVQSKMHNLSISCATVCVILLGSAAVLGTFGIVKRELSAILVTGVMYILAALFAVFSLVIMHCKRNSRQESGIVDDVLIVSSEYNESRVFANSWSMLLGWIGSGLILVASLFWLFLAKVMRYHPLTVF